MHIKGKNYKDFTYNALPYEDCSLMVARVSVTLNDGKNKTYVSACGAVFDIDKLWDGSYGYFKNKEEARTLINKLTNNRRGRKPKVKV